MPKSNMGTIVFGILVVGLLAAFLIPTVVADTSNDRVLTTTQNEGETITVYNSLNATLDNVTSTNATVTLENTRTGSTSTLTIDNSTNQTTTIDDSDVTVHVNSVTAGTSAELEYTYHPTFGWDRGPKAIISNLPTILLGLLLFSFLGLTFITFRD